MSFGDLLIVDAAGFQFPDFNTILTFVQDKYKTIYGADVNLSPSSQDGIFLDIFSLVVFDTVQDANKVYNSFSPLTAQGDALTRNVKINGIIRGVPSKSQVDLEVVGVVGTNIVNGQAEDDLGQKWDMPALVIIPGSGTITVSALADEEGAVPASAGTITKIVNPTLGWQSVTNTLPAIEGNPVETDPNLRIKQSQSTMKPSSSILDGIVGAVANVTGVVEYRGYENDTGGFDPLGIPGNSIAIIADGGDTQDIADQIALKKTAGTGTFGTTSEVTTDSQGITNTIFFSRSIPADIIVNITIKPQLNNYSATTTDLIKLSVAEYINTLAIGEELVISNLCTEATLNNEPVSKTYKLLLPIEANKNGGAFVDTEILLQFNEKSTITVNEVNVTLQP